MSPTSLVLKFDTKINDSNPREILIIICIRASSYCSIFRR